MIKKLTYSIIIICIVLLTSCKENYQPKAHGYLRITYPEKSYTLYNSNDNYSYMLADYCHVEYDTINNKEKFWSNIVFENMNAKIHLSYNLIDNNFETLLEDAHTMAYKHSVKADAINRTIYENDSTNVFGLIYDIKGNVASPVQFFATDSLKYFLRGSLYFNSVPNKDSLYPCIKFIREDIQKLMETLQWNNKK